MQHEWERMLSEEQQTGHPTGIPQLNVSRYTVPPPTERTAAGWLEAYNNAAAQLQHQQNRVDNLELLLHYSGNAWKLYNENCERERQRLTQELENLRKEVNNLNLQRKKAQTEVAPALARAEQEWVELIRKNMEIERACTKLEEQIASLKRTE
eukprot:TRINITY_DN11087_c0_g2_i1.p1 TRINITY_DN11087_c0_g2~~TRINITY_DN11087_c0_g2_i1.p1  ORF type:complete len:153 (-),score=41.44 TRINITY_DN11087_c0_g2_i1:77-535(-)